MNNEKETVDEFMDRIYVHFPSQTVFVYPNKYRRDNAYIKHFKPEKWNFQTALNYIHWLEAQENEA